MRVVEVEGTNPDHSHQLAGLLEPVVLSQLGDADRQVAVAVQLLPVDDDVVRAVHRAELELLAVFEMYRRVHRVVVELPVAALLVQVELRQVRRDDVLVAAPQLFVDDPALELAPDGRAVGQPDDLAQADPFVEGEDLQLFAQLLVVALLRLLEELHVVVELALRHPGGAVDASQLRLLLVAAPVRARDAKQFERLELFGGPHMRTSAEVEKVAGAIQADLVAFDLVRDQLELEVLAALAELFHRVVARNNLFHKRDVGLREPAHAGLDGGEV